MKNVRMSSDWLRVVLLLSEISCSMAFSVLYGKERTMLMLFGVWSFEEWWSVQSSNQFCWVLLLINIHIFDYLDPWLSILFRAGPTSPDNRGSTVILLFYWSFCANQHLLCKYYLFLLSSISFLVILSKCYHSFYYYIML